MFFVPFPRVPMTDLLEAANALVRSIDALPDVTWIETTAHVAPELEQLARAIKLTEEQIEVCGEVSGQLAE